ncbi:NAD-dependent epimerase/dehydratase family protein [Parvularcula dongshanensis]|uniref:Nucleoside-diphosphate-sugar epimerase n=1 Tax=Parvularcula dongshanensis TaxID=1173995 RepID=A0A840I235_9PROT|nr:nucleoside-diphosphate-sugar epimerase [Parvularcula dongshanensis]
MPSLLAIGAGYSVRPLLRRLADEGWAVTGTTRSEEKADALRSEGVTALRWAAPARLPEEVVRTADAIVVSVSPGEEGCPALHALPEETLRAETRLLYLSSSGVYGDKDGAWIDETATCTPGTARGRRRLEAEAGWQALAARVGARLTLCRLAGIYGPGRNAVESLSGGTRGARSGLSQRVIKPGQVFNRIHRDDIAGGLHALLDADAPPGVVNFADDEPSPPQDVIAYAARLLGVGAPPEVPFEAAEMSDMARSFYAENKRLRNDQLRSLPAFALRYPTYREGLDAAVRSLRTEA